MYITLEVQPTTTIAEVRKMIVDRAFQLYWPDELHFDRCSLTRENPPFRPWPVLYHSGRCLMQQQETLSRFGIGKEMTLMNVYPLLVPGKGKDADAEDDDEDKEKGKRMTVEEGGAEEDKCIKDNA